MNRNPILERLAVLAAALALGASALAQQPAPASPVAPVEKAAPAVAADKGSSAGEKGAPAADIAAVRARLEQKFPGAEIKSITRTAYLGGLYEIYFDDRLIYTDAKVNHVLVGAVYDTNTKTNLTDDRMRKLTRVSVANLPLELAIKKVKGNGSRRLIIFSDADCPFCKRLEEEMKGLDNVTIYTFLFPIDQLHPDAARKSKIIWCSTDRAKAWDEFFATGTLPDNKGECQTPVEATQALGAKLRIQATPTMVLADGTLLPGAVPLARLESEMKAAEIEAKKLAAAPKK